MKAYAYQASARPEVHACLPPKATRVLDVGCNDGSFGAFLRTRYPDAEIWGVEPNEDQARLARERLDKVIVDYYDPGPSMLESAGVFDLITFNHVIEHIYDPWVMLEQTSQLLAPRGNVAAVVPNVRYAPFLANVVVRGEWEYVDSGLLDRTHIRFFTRRSITHLFEGAGFELEELLPVNAMGGVRSPRAAGLVSRALGDLAFGGFAVKARLKDQALASVDSTGLSAI